MVTIKDYKTIQKEDGTEFQVLIVQGDIETVKSQETGKLYLTARTARMACTFDRETCESIIGSTLEGKVKKVKVEPYEYAIPETGEIIELSHRYEYISDDKPEESELEQPLVMVA